MTSMPPGPPLPDSLLSVMGICFGNGALGSCWTNSMAGAVGKGATGAIAVPGTWFAKTDLGRDSLIFKNYSKL
jgi:hypothetical protein